MKIIRKDTILFSAREYLEALEFEKKNPDYKKVEDSSNTYFEKVSVYKYDNWDGNKMNKVILHPNGYSIKLYGDKELSVYNSEGIEVLRTYVKNNKTEEELIDWLEDIPKFLEFLGIEVSEDE